MNNHDFEQGDGGGWIAPSLTIIGDGTGPSGNLYAKVSGRTQSSQDKLFEPHVYIILKASELGESFKIISR